MNKIFKNIVYPFTDEILNSYSILFFSNSRLLGVMLLIVTFFKPFAGLSGLAAVILAIFFSSSAGLNRAGIHKGLFSYNALLIGIGMGTFYNPGMAFWLLLFLAVLLSVIISAVLWNILSKKGLPFLAIPFVLCFWLVIMVSREFAAIDLTTRNIYWINEMYAIGDKSLVNFMMFFENLPVHPLIITFFKSLSSLFFQDNVLAGIIIFIGLLLHSRIGITLLIAGFITSVLFNDIVHAYDNGINYYLLGANFIMVTVAIGSFFVIPSLHSYLWALICVPITFIIVISLSKITGLFQLPVYSLPFCFVTIIMIFFFSIKQQKGRIVLSPLQLYSPEKNLYNYLSAKERTAYGKYFHLQLPFLGQWIVSQGYDGNITHKGDWSKALDFVIVDSEMKTYTHYATKPENFYCYNKPVLAPANGFVYEIIDYIEDNEIGKINQQQNWGNTIIIKHAEGLYTKMCHLRKNSFKVNVGDYVKQGEVVAACGNSGRSPEPHLHFQVQGTPYVGSKTIYYPFASYKINKNQETDIAEFKIPAETEFISNVIANENLVKAFEFLPGYRVEVSADGYADSTWEVFTDACNNSYIYCYQTKAVAYFNRLNNVFYFISFYGDRNSLLYYFYLSCYKICLSTEAPVVIKDKFPLQFSKNNPGKWLQDFVAPFYIFNRLHYESENRITSTDIFDSAITISGRQILQYFTLKKIKMESLIEIKDQAIKSFTFLKNNKNIKAICTPKG
ncbi:MAG: urea transporter [Sphingobacteriales bacterium]|nr:urea transporter [Sphingobacteriales bacterium]